MSEPQRPLRSLHSLPPEGADPSVGTAGRDSRDARDHTRADYRHFLAIPTRWMDNDTYGHVNNVTYYSYFDTVVNEHLIREGGLDIRGGDVVGLVVETSCRFYRPLSFPETIDAGMRVSKLGRSSVTYEIALFRTGETTPAASGRFVHVWVDRDAMKPTDIPPQVRAALQPLVAAQ